MAASALSRANPGAADGRAAGARRGALGALLLLLASCATPAPPVAVSHDMGLVRAETVADARHFGDLVAELQPRVIDLLPGSVPRDTEVWIQERLQHRYGQLAPENVKGFTLIGTDNGRGRIHLRRNTDHPQWFLAHELVHALLGPDWRTLPGALEEGLCDVIAAQLAEDATARIRALRAVEASLFLGRMRVVVEFTPLDPAVRSSELEVDFHYESGGAGVSLEELLGYDTLGLKRRWKRLPDSFYGIGFAVVERIRERHGLEYLHQLCLRAAREGHAVVPYQWLTEAAGLDSADALLGVPYELIGAAEFGAWRELVPGFHADLLSQLFRERYGSLGSDQLLERLAPRLRLAQGARVELAELTGLPAELGQRWPRGGSARAGAAAADADPR
jgi:hypothetical protein